MKRLIATERGAYQKRKAHEYISRDLVSPATARHERIVNIEMRWPALPSHLRAMPNWRAMIRHWVATGYEWTPPGERP